MLVRPGARPLHRHHAAAGRDLDIDLDTTCILCTAPAWRCCHGVMCVHGSAEWPVFVIAARRGNSATDDTYGHVGTRKYENQKKMMKDC